MNKKRAGLLSGFLDFLPEVELMREAMIDKVTGVFKLYGYGPQDTPCLEYAETLLDKYGENQKLVYEFEDNGGRKVALRYDLTVPLSRVVPSYPSKIKLPFKRYQVGKVWRADRPGKGRFREFIQVDADTIGTSSPQLDSELVMVTLDVIAALKLTAYVRINDKRILDALSKTCGLTEEQKILVLRSIDKLDKIGQDAVVVEISKIGLDAEKLDIVQQYLGINGIPREVITSLRDLLQPCTELDEGCKVLETVFETVFALGYDAKSLRIDPCIARGLDYYTGVIFETMLVDNPEFGSICSGGRYDSIVKDGNGRVLPAAGVSIGLDRLFAAMLDRDQLPNAEAVARVLITNMGDSTARKATEIASSLRRAGISVLYYPEKAKLAKQLGYASDLKIPWALIVGPEEIEAGMYTIRSMVDRQQTTVPQDQIIKSLR